MVQPMQIPPTLAQPPTPPIQSRLPTLHCTTGPKRIMRRDLGNPGESTERQVFDGGLSGCGQGDGFVIACQTRGYPKHIDASSDASVGISATITGEGICHREAPLECLSLVKGTRASNRCRAKFTPKP